MMELNQDNEQWKLLIMILKEIAENKGITHQQIADDTGLFRSNVSRVFSLKYKPNLDIFLRIAKSVKVNFFFEDQEGTSDLNLIFEKAMSSLGRRPEDLPKN